MNTPGPDTIQVLDDFLASELDMVLHIRSDGDIDLSEDLCAYLHNASTLSAVHFQFDPHDARYSNLRSMLRTGTSLFACHCRGNNGVPLSRILIYVQSMQAWATRDWIYYWDSLYSPNLLLSSTS